MSQIGDSATFSKVTNAWRAVAEEIAPLVGRKSKQVSIKMVLVPMVKETEWGTLTDFLIRPPITGATPFTESGAHYFEEHPR